MLSAMIQFQEGRESSENPVSLSISRVKPYLRFRNSLVSFEISLCESSLVPKRVSTFKLISCHQLIAAFLSLSLFRFPHFASLKNSNWPRKISPLAKIQHQEWTPETTHYRPIRCCLTWWWVPHPTPQTPHLTLTWSTTLIRPQHPPLWWCTTTSTSSRRSPGSLLLVHLHLSLWIPFPLPPVSMMEPPRLGSQSSQRRRSAAVRESTPLKVTSPSAWVLLRRLRPLGLLLGLRPPSHYVRRTEEGRRGQGRSKWML